MALVEEIRSFKGPPRKGGCHLGGRRFADDAGDPAERLKSRKQKIKVGNGDGTKNRRGITGEHKAFQTVRLTATAIYQKFQGFGSSVKEHQARRHHLKSTVVKGV